MSLLLIINIIYNSHGIKTVKGKEMNKKSQLWIPKTDIFNALVRWSQIKNYNKCHKKTYLLGPFLHHCFHWCWGHVVHVGCFYSAFLALLATDVNCAFWNLTLCKNKIHCISVFQWQIWSTVITLQIAKRLRRNPSWRLSAVLPISRLLQSIVISLNFEWK